MLLDGLEAEREQDLPAADMGGPSTSFLEGNTSIRLERPILMPLPCGLHDLMQIGFEPSPSQKKLTELRVGDQGGRVPRAAATFDDRNSQRLTDSTVVMTSRIECPRPVPRLGLALVPPARRPLTRAVARSSTPGAGNCVPPFLLATSSNAHNAADEAWPLFWSRI